MPAGTSDDGLRLLTDREAYAPADTIALTVLNDADRPLGYGRLCTGELQWWGAGGWEGPQPPFYEDPAYGVIDCDLDLPGLEPGGRASESYRLNQNLVAGTYRWCGNEYEISDPLSRGSSPFCSEPFEIKP